MDFKQFYIDALATMDSSHLSNELATLVVLRHSVELDKNVIIQQIIESAWGAMVDEISTRFICETLEPVDC